MGQHAFERVAGFPEHLRALRKARGLTLAQLGARIGVRHEVVSKYELGLNNPSVPALCRLADALGVTTDALLGRRSGQGWTD